MNGKIVIGTIGASLAIWVVAIIALIAYASDPIPARLLIFSILALIAPIILIVGFTPAALRVRRNLHKQSTRIKNAETALSRNRRALTPAANGAQLVEHKGNPAAVHSVNVNNGPTPEIPAPEVDPGATKAVLDGLKTRITRYSNGLNKLDSLTASTLHNTESALVRLAAIQNIPIGSLFTSSQASNYLLQAVGRGNIIDTLTVFRAFPDRTDQLTLTQSRALMARFRQLGHLEETAQIMGKIAERSSKKTDQDKSTIFQSEFQMFNGTEIPSVQLPPFDGEINSDTILHFVGKALPETQTGYTLRTQYTVEAIQRLGVKVVVVSQSGATKQSPRITESYIHQGVPYFLLGGPQRNTVPWDQWLASNIAELASVVHKLRPAVLHTHSDFLNAIIVQYVGDAYGIPVVNETRGFWEESWLSRKANAEGWDDLDRISELGVVPSAYTLRKEREIEYRSRAAVVVTLADVMRDHIEDLASTYGSPVKQIEIVPNAVDTESFPVSTRNSGLISSLGISPDATIVGYISSIVEYEGIDVLVRAFFELVSARSVYREYHSPVSFLSSQGLEPDEEPITNLADRLRQVHTSIGSPALIELSRELLESVSSSDNQGPLHLIVVGDGAELEGLRALVDSLEMSDAVTFTGRVPHEEILSFYSIIDLFVVPRRPTTVTDLVTPLKPFEAMSTGRPCIFSDVAALAEIATASQAAATFKAGDHHDLARTMSALLRDPEILKQMSVRGAAWVRRARTWNRNAEKYLEIYKSLGAGPDSLDTR